MTECSPVKLVQGGLCFLSAVDIGANKKLRKSVKPQSASSR